MIKIREISSAICLLWASATIYAGEVERLPNVLKPSSMFTATGVMAERTIPKFPKSLVYNAEIGNYEGIKYSIDYAYANGTIANSDPASLEGLATNWDVSCSKDPMTDAIACLVLKGNMFIHYSRKRGYTISVGLDHYPGYSSSIRVGDGKPYVTTNYGGFSAATSQKILQEMKKSSLVRTRYVEWPYPESKDSQASLYGLSAVLAYMKWAAVSYK
jgi:hypothetical protein